MLHASFLIFPLYISIAVDFPPALLAAESGLLFTMQSVACFSCSWTMGLPSMHLRWPWLHDLRIFLFFLFLYPFLESTFSPAFSAPVTSHLNISSLTTFLLYGIMHWYLSHATNFYFMSGACSSNSILPLFISAVLTMQGTLTGRFIY